ncbi:hypothetical protein [Methanococcoides sp. NM1]|uniref:hypothetical protein n=1 Tax=Methanococcoides sp. NM1 TaxID=1201013 RepID=UPI001083C5CB|nr:hypothetical protein [Methanococcoides sp. NM1]
MKIKLKFGMSVSFVLLLLIGLAFVGSADTNNRLPKSLENNDEGNILDIDQTNNAEYTFIFGLGPFEHEAIASVGTLPEFNTVEEKQEWILGLKELNEGLKDGMVSSYMYPYGEVLTCGYNSNGILVILFENKTIEQDTMDEIYTFVDEKARDLNIQDVPVEFGRGEYWQQYEIDMNFLSESELEADKEFMKSGRGIYQPTVIARYGKLPLLTTDEQRSDFGNDLMDILHDVRLEMEPYMDNGQVVEYGVTFGPSVEVGMNKNEIDDVQTLCDEVYGIFDEEAKQMGINEIPVTFIESGMIIDDVEIVEESDVVGPGLSESDLAIIDNETTQEEPGTNKQTPGFTSIMLIIGLLLSARSRK